MATDEHVLITGLPSLGARKLLLHILEREPSTRVTGLVLPKFLAQAAELVDGMSEAERARVVLLEGDTAAMDLGLSGAEFRDLAATVTLVHHLAHVSYLGAGAEQAETTNVGGAVELIELARAADQLRCLVHHSTAYVSGNRTGLVLESELEMGQRFHSPVHASRYEAERVMRRAMPDVPIAVLRPTMLVGDSITGQVDRLDGPYLLVMLVLGLPGDVRMPLPSDDKGGRLDIVPIDYVVRAAHTIARHPKAVGRTFHLASREQHSPKDVFDLIAKAGGRRTGRGGDFASRMARTLMRTPGVERLLREPRIFLQQVSTGARFDTSNARAILDEAGVVCPPLAAYVDTWVRAVQEQQARE